MQSTSIQQTHNMKKLEIPFGHSLPHSFIQFENAIFQQRFRRPSLYDDCVLLYSLHSPNPDRSEQCHWQVLLAAVRNRSPTIDTLLVVPHHSTTPTTNLTTKWNRFDRHKIYECNDSRKKKRRAKKKTECAVHVLKAKIRIKSKSWQIEQ